MNRLLDTPCKVQESLRLNIQKMRPIIICLAAANTLSNFGKRQILARALRQYPSVALTKTARCFYGKLTAAEGVIVLKHDLAHTRLCKRTDRTNKVLRKSLVKGTVRPGANVTCVGNDVSIAVWRVTVTGRNAAVTNGGRQPRTDVKSVFLKKRLVLLECFHALPQRLFIGEKPLENQKDGIGFRRLQLAQNPLSLNLIILRKLNGNTKSV